MKFKKFFLSVFSLCVLFSGSSLVNSVYGKEAPTRENENNNRIRPDINNNVVRHIGIDVPDDFIHIDMSDFEAPIHIELPRPEIRPVEIPELHIEVPQIEVPLMQLDAEIPTVFISIP